jgi:hypothetical protein
MDFIKKYDLHLKIIVIIITIIQPFILLSTQGVRESISSYWETPLQPLFIFVNATTSYYLFSVPKWRFSSIFLLLLTAFSVTQFKLIHNIFAILFFISCFISLLSVKRFRYYGILYIISLPLLFLLNFLWFEIYATIIIVSYHLHTIIYKQYLDYKREKSLR